MKHRTALPENERRARSRATQLIHDKPLIVGGLVEMANTCGKPNCKCTKGEKAQVMVRFLATQGEKKDDPYPPRVRKRGL